MSRASRTSEVPGAYTTDPFEYNGEGEYDPRRAVPTMSYDEEIGGGFWVQVPSAFILLESYSPEAKLLYIVLLSYAGNKETAFPSIDTLGRKIGRSKNVVLGALSELEERNLLTKKRRGQGLPNIYHIKKFRGDLR